MIDKIICAACNSSETSVIESRPCHNGTRRRRHRCLSCGYRWTAWDGARPPKGRLVGSRGTGPRRGRPTTSDEVKRILLAPLSVTNAQLAREMGFSGEWIRMVRVGLTHTNIHPELERRKPAIGEAKGRSCYNCANWSAGCGFGFPDPMEEGPGYAQDCDLFKLKEH